MIVLAFAMLLTCGAWAQGQRREFNAADMAQRRTENLEKQLNLDSIQSKKVYALYLEQADSMKVRMEKMFQGAQQGGGQRMQMTDEQRASMKAEQEAFDAKMKAILTEDQYAKYQKLPRGGFGGRRGGGQGGGQQGGEQQN